jgi:CheY-like chemotaxis protein
VSDTPKFNILVLEDDDAYRRLVVRILAGAGFDVLEARDFASAIAIVEGTQRIDLLLADVGMPAQTPQGMSIARMSQIRRHGLKTIYMTGGDAKQCAFYANDEMVLQKPFTADVLVEAVSTVLGMREHAC